MPDALETLLAKSPLSQAQRADLWDAYHNAPDADALASTLKSMGVPTHVKANLWDLKANEAPAVEAPAAPTAAVTPERTWGDTAVDLAKGVGAGLATTVYGGGDLIRRAVGMERIIDQPDVKAAMTPPESLPGKLGYHGEQIGEFFLPTGLVGKAGKVAEVVKAGALTAAQSGGDPLATGLSAGLSAIPGEAILAKTSKALKSSALETMAGSLKATKEWAKIESEKLAPEMLKRGIGGSIKTVRAHATKMAEKVGKNLHQAYETAAAAGETVPGLVIQGNIQLASDSLHTLAATGKRIAVPGNEAAIEQLDKLDKFVSQLSPNIKVNQAAAIKQQFDDIVERAGLFGPKALASASEKAQGWSFKKAADSFREMLNTNPTIEKLNEEASFWIGLRNVAKATKIRRVGQVGGLIPTIAGTGGAAVGASVGGPLGAAGGAFIGNRLARIIQSPAYMSKVSAPLKNALADALASGSVGRVESVTSRILASTPAQLAHGMAP